MGINEKLEEITELLKKQAEEGKIKEKKWKFPFGKKVGKGQKKKNYVTTLLINENGTYDFKKYKIEDQTILHDTIPRLATSGHVLFNKKGNPMIILPNWGIEPFSPFVSYLEYLKGSGNTNGYKILMAKMKSQTIDTKKSFPGWIKWVLGAIALAVIGYAVVSGGF